MIFRQANVCVYGRDITRPFTAHYRQEKKPILEKTVQHFWHSLKEESIIRKKKYH